MAIQQQNDHHHQKRQPEDQSFLIDALYCDEEEEEWGEEGLDIESVNDRFNIYDWNPSFSSLLLLEQDLFWEDEELVSLFTKEKETCLKHYDVFEADPCLSLARRQAVKWMLKVNCHYGFSALTAVLSINYLDRFLSGLHFQKDQPWMIELAAVTCLSLAAKVEETQIPLLLDFQVEDTKYVFEAKTIQRMELLVLSTLQWRMNPVTPLSFLDHIIRRLGLKCDIHWEFLRRCESLLLSVLTGSRFVSHLPSVLATATMLHVIHQVQPCNAIEYQNQLLSVLKISQENVNDCYQQLISQISNTNCCNGQNKVATKRKYHQVPSSPSGVVGASFSSSDNSNDSSDVGLSVSSAPEPLFKKSRVQEQKMSLPSLSRVFVDVASPH